MHRLVVLPAIVGTARAAHGSPATFLGSHRCILAASKQRSCRPPLVLIGGTAQWVDSMVLHLPSLSKQRDVVVYETRGQGATTLPVDDCSLSRHAADFWEVVEAAGWRGRSVDVAGFSFGARVAMAACVAGASGPGKVRRVCVTGVAADRGALGRLQLQSWRASLRANDLEGFAWQLVLSTHSAEFLARNEERIERAVAAVVQANSAAKLRAIVEQTHTDDPEHPEHPMQLAATIRTQGLVDSGLLIVGDCDALCPAVAARQLAGEAGWGFCEVEGAGHAVLLEKALQWRKELLGFLDAPES